MKIAHHHQGSLRTRFTCRFLWALKNLNKNKNKSCSYHKVKIAAYSSMASAVGSRRTWSRALLRRIRIRRQRQRQRQGNHGSIVLKRRIRRAKHKKKRVVSRNGDDDEAAVSKLRELVPGGEMMGFSSLLDESAHYIKCLNMQVQIMRNIADILSV